ncbi:hypothetical protein DPMN_090098 [Dreissena polymorpha]|uniref:Uncharacterized protein n=1 Tax=Dreissena polymorpha TaxID=45954 RepID=A0A9D4KZ29_DREPO|nr:hypothetical protein DPMN_090098 [Dreissena polymorpha]
MVNVVVLSLEWSILGSSHLNGHCWDPLLGTVNAGALSPTFTALIWTVQGGNPNIDCSKERTPILKVPSRRPKHGLLKGGNSNIDRSKERTPALNVQRRGPQH